MTPGRCPVLSVSCPPTKPRQRLATMGRERQFDFASDSRHWPTFARPDSVGASSAPAPSAITAVANVAAEVGWRISTEQCGAPH